MARLPGPRIVKSGWFFQFTHTHSLSPQGINTQPEWLGQDKIQDLPLLITRTVITFLPPDPIYWAWARRYLFSWWVLFQGHLCLPLQSDFDKTTPISNTFKNMLETQFWTVLSCLLLSRRKDPKLFCKLMKMIELRRRTAAWIYHQKSQPLPGQDSFSISSNKIFDISLPPILSFQVLSSREDFLLVQVHSDPRYLRLFTLLQPECTNSFPFLIGSSW